MVKVDYISTTDINRVGKIHSNKKYINWNLKVVDNEYRFYPPIVVDELEEEVDDFDFTKEEDDISFLEKLLSTPSEKKEIPMFGEIWDKTAKFINEEKFHFVGYIEETIVDRKRSKIKKGMNCVARIEKYDKETGKPKKKSSKEIDENIELLKDEEKDNAYKAQKIQKGNSVLSKINKFKNESVDSVSVSVEQLDNKQDEVEILTNEVEMLTF